jgi:hypothetical protein
VKQTRCTGEVANETDDALLFYFDDDPREFWIPRSVIVGGDLSTIGETELLIADWWLEDKGVL